MFNTYSDNIQDNTKAKNKMNGQNKFEFLITIVFGVVVVLIVALFVKGCDITTQRNNEYIQICIANGGTLDRGSCSKKQ